ncbi:hypothetical protein RJ639_044340 [Escallonia herrerae]|uniref:ent-kaurene synthase n=1 Tax=Escallonia herrerae TaxID=1293975 RepID=A0AA88WN72_9ASTE|nr:hypothetical protein RJ639_044340 [Escallonia herrerae]
MIDNRFSLLNFTSHFILRQTPSFEGTKERIRNLFNKVELSVSSYDTAWVAMVPSPQNSEAPRFPRCVNWLLDNQLNDGSWGLPHHSPILLKDVLSSTLACVLALKRWGIGEEHINKGLHFIELNVASVTDISKPSPIGFDIIFPSMLKYAEDLNLKLPLEPTALTAMLQKRELELTRCCESRSQVRGAYLGYISEGMGKLQDWEMVMRYQRKNGSLFNSPSTTATALTHLKNDGCLNYLYSLLEKFGNAVPTVYPSDIYLRLCVVDNLERLGIDRHFNIEIRNVLDEAYRCWLQGEEEIFMDAATSAMAFRILRMSGYDVSSDALTQVIKEESCYNSLGGHLKETSDVLELYRASQLTIYEDESALEEQNSLSSDFLKQNLLNRSIPSNRLARYVSKEVDDALNFPFHASLERITNRRNIEHYNVDNTRILKSSYCSSHFSNKDFLKLAVEDFNICQSIHREELKYLERWVVELSLDKLKFARQRAAYCYFSAAASFFSPELSDARISWAKNGVLTTVVDDFFDVGGSIEELLNLIQLFEKWDVNGETDFCSEEVRIIFLALRQTICEIGEQAFRRQARSVTSHIVEIWLNLLHSMLKEAEWARDMFVPTINEYMTNGYVSFALGPIVLPALYLVGPELSEEVVRSFELNNLFKLMSTTGRLLNDIQSFKRESREGKLNAVSLHMMHSSGSVTEEEAIGEMKGFIDGRRRELLRLVLQERDSIVPRVCKDLFWKMSKVLHLFYIKDDGFTSDDMIRTVKAIIHEPIGSF